jgi:hypothetical protein
MALNKKIILVSLALILSSTPLLLKIGKASNCHTAQRKTKRVEREITIMAVFSEGGGGGFLK